MTVRARYIDRWVYGWAQIADGLVVVLTLGRIVTHWNLKPLGKLLRRSFIVREGEPVP